MSSRHHIDDFMRGRIIGKIEEGRKITDVARAFDIAHTVVSRLWKSFKTTGMCSRRHGGGRVRSTMPAEDRYIVLSAKRNRRTTAQQVANQFLAASGKQISRKTVARRLRGGGLYARRPVVCVPLTRQHRTARLQRCCEHHNWTEQDWACVLFSDEKNIQEKDRYPTCSIMVWAGIMINGRTRLHVVANGTMTGQRYIDEVLLPHDCLDSEGIQRLVWQARSPDLNPIENVWNALGRQVAGRNYPPTNKNTLIRALTEEWDKLPQQLLDNVVQKELLTELARDDSVGCLRTHWPWERTPPTTMWVPSHIGIPSNERADQKAKQGAESTQPEVPLTLRRAKNTNSTHIDKYTAMTQKRKSFGKPWETLTTLGPIPRHLEGAEAVARFLLTTRQDFLGVYLHWLRVAANKTCPLCGHARMDSDHLPKCTGLAEYPADDIISRYWEARCQMV
ncbi:transposable element Tcb1 transposase [Trichonephila clavipes]|nr:transposable element Tcb1 transposase [Trichonephila clavipes]